jgi:3'-phosphoadenosine 5'-phosphosulfate (PAPS) 3'-phosphatase
MNQHFPEVKIIGEEDMSKTIDYDVKYITNTDKFEFMLDETDIPEEVREIKTEDLCLYVDPIDSTEQFIKRNYAPVTSLIGIALKGDAYIGMIHFPFYKGEKANSLVFFNIPMRGIFTFNTDTNEIKKVEYKAQNDELVFVSSASKRNTQICECKFIV